MINHAIQTDVRKRELETPVQKRILQALAALADENGEINRSIPEIALRAQAHRNTVLRVLHELADQEEILILNPQRVKGCYHINHLPDDKKPPVDSLRTPIADAIRLLPLPVRVSVVFQGLAQYASRSGNNIFPSLKTLIRDTGYSKPVIQETLQWLLQAQFIAVDKDCVTPKYQSRVGYKIPGWNFVAQILAIDEAQIEQIKLLYHQRHKSYWLEHKNIEAGQAQEEDESTWLEDHSFDVEECLQDAPTWPNDDEDEKLGDEEGIEELDGEESETGVEDLVVPPQDPQGEELGERGASLPSFTPSERIRAVLAPERRRNAEVSLKTYIITLKMMEPHLKLIEDHENGSALVDEATLNKSRKIIGFCQQTIDTYELQCEQRE